MAHAPTAVIAENQSPEPNVCVRVIQTNNVATDDHGYIYIVDRANTGLHILQIVGDTKKIIEGD